MFWLIEVLKFLYEKSLPQGSRSLTEKRPICPGRSPFYPVRMPTPSAPNVCAAVVNRSPSSFSNARAFALSPSKSRFATMNSSISSPRKSRPDESPVGAGSSPRYTKIASWSSLQLITKGKRRPNWPPFSVGEEHHDPRRSRKLTIWWVNFSGSTRKESWP